ncbi:MAG: iron-sulfur cluster-binding protein [Candidatus Tectomicrobia bacterium]|nr:iron-sulfur cluster-binding protein [Candidatus Tectomicrobia bacterium]
MHVHTDQFSEQSKVALSNVHLQEALQKATDRFIGLRMIAFSELPEGEALRGKGRAIKEETIHHLDEYLEQLEAQVIKNGGVVHWARNAEEACRCIVDLALQRGVKLVVKSKSMTTEEISLNEALGKAGIEAVETDLGEYIIQLAGETPSHIIAPAIHKSKEDVSELFSKKLGIERYDEVEKLTQVARQTLREKFCQAGMGISGVNFAAAETGTIVVVENEGNARLTTSMPPIHVAVMGIEKVIPKLEDLAVFLKILARSATGQKMSSYVSLITGPGRPSDRDGPSEFHLVILDNGRSKILKHEELRESLFCLRCGACLNVCPVYQKIGGHAYGWVYSGPIGAVITPQLVGLHRSGALPYASSLCGACAEACPVKINIPHLLLKLRSMVVDETDNSESGGPSRMERLAILLWAFSMRHRWIYEALSTIASKLQKLFLPFPFSRWTESRDFPHLAEKSFRRRWREKKR